MAAGHWSADWAIVGGTHFEVMSSTIDAAAAQRYLSTVTVGAMQDLGYVVNYAQADLDGILTVDDYQAVRTDAPVSSDGMAYVVSVDAGEDEAGLVFGARPANVTFKSGAKPELTGRLRGLTWIDANGNGRKERTEKRLNCTLFLDLDRDRVWDSGEPKLRIRTGA